MTPSLQITVVITGCTKGGLGYELAKAFVERGCTVFATSRKIQGMEGLQELGCILECLDITSPDSVKKAIANILSHPGSNGRIDVLINNSGALKIGAFVEFDFEKELRNILEVNLTGTMRVTHEVLNKSMLQNKDGLIITIGSLVAKLPQIWSSPYSAAKAGVHGWSMALREELRPFNIDVLYVNSGGIKSNMTKKMPDEAIIKEGRSSSPSHRNNYNSKTTLQDRHSPVLSLNSSPPIGNEGKGNQCLRRFMLIRLYTQLLDHLEH
ncbi:NAD(P)-binding protein [Atractiella rhizophila]|nr:NAD(P)-binding protein [Atractiella rhizophila]